MKPGTCKHYNGSFHNKSCEAGVCYRDVTPDSYEPGSHFREPCRTVESEHGLKVLKETGPQGTCDKYEEPTAEEIAKYERDMAESVVKMLRTMPLIEKIKLAHRGEDWKGTEECQECGGVLHLNHAATNGHVWGWCETDGCLRWVE